MQHVVKNCNSFNMNSFLRYKPKVNKEVHSGILVLILT